MYIETQKEIVEQLESIKLNIRKHYANRRTADNKERYNDELLHVKGMLQTLINSFPYLPGFGELPASAFENQIKRKQECLNIGV